MQGHLLTKDRVGAFGIQTDGKSEICHDKLEDHNHLLFQCEFSKKCWSLLWDWLDIRFPLIGLSDWYRSWRCKSLIQKQVIAAAIAGLIYHIWFARNVCRVEARLQAPWAILQQIKGELKARFRGNTRIEFVQNSAWACQLLAI
ncbi:uncharacterized protein LOC141658385 [Silene latifolia]|uniref:uncharacterized protein LOC141658385 n=1 Tax=Silene latifolia TaxID=37657 RepID=UPI003D785D8D